MACGWNWTTPLTTSRHDWTSGAQDTVFVMSRVVFRASFGEQEVDDGSAIAANTARNHQPMIQTCASVCVLVRVLVWGGREASCSISVCVSNRRGSYSTQHTQQHTAHSTPYFAHTAHRISISISLLLFNLCDTYLCRHHVVHDKVPLPLLEPCQLSNHV